MLGKDEQTDKGDVAGHVFLKHNLLYVLAWRILELELRLSMQQYNLGPSLHCAVYVNLILCFGFIFSCVCDYTTLKSIN